MEQVQEAVNQQQDNSLSVQTVQIGKHIASFLVPDYNEGQKLSVIDDGVLKYMKDLLPRADGREIVKDLIGNLSQLLDKKTIGHVIVKDAVSECKDFVAFHTSINLLKEYFDPKVTVVRQSPFNVEPPKPKKFSEMTEFELNAIEVELDEQSAVLEKTWNEWRKAMEALKPNVASFKPTVTA